MQICPRDSQGRPTVIEGHYIPLTSTKPEPIRTSRTVPRPVFSTESNADTLEAAARLVRALTPP